MNRTQLCIMTQSDPCCNRFLSRQSGMHGSGRFGAQCGMVEGGLLFLGIIGRNDRVPDDEIITNCRNYARGFKEAFGSLQCSILHPERFNSSDPPHWCEDLTNRALRFTIDCITGLQGVVFVKKKALNP